MKISRGTDYGIQGILYLARQPLDKVNLLHDVAQTQNVPESYLAKIFQDLVKAGLVRSHRGAKGGFSLAQPGSQITLRQVIEALQGPISLNRCLDVREGCPNSETCPVSEVLRKAQQQILATLEAANLDSLIGKEPVRKERRVEAVVDVKPEQLRATGNWKS
jgi:Rrf2 family iron-sulfur cluster assembly transcriptional regulator